MEKIFNKFADIFANFNEKVIKQYTSLPRAIQLLLCPAYVIFAVLDMLVALIFTIANGIYGRISCGLPLKEYLEYGYASFKEGFNEAKREDSKA